PLLLPPHRQPRPPSCPLSPYTTLFRSSPTPWPPACRSVTPSPPAARRTSRPSMPSRWPSGSRSCSSSPRSSSRAPPPRSPSPRRPRRPLRHRPASPPRPRPRRPTTPRRRTPPPRPSPRRSPPRPRPPSDPRGPGTARPFPGPSREAHRLPLLQHLPTRKRNMANYTAADIKEIRESTGAGIAKREGRTASEGLIAVDIRDSEGGQTGTLVELNSETDFVAKNDKF